MRRSAELLGIIMAYVTYQLTTRDGQVDQEKKERLERLSNLFVGAMMCLGGSFMVLLAFLSDAADKGNVIPGLAIAVMGVIANTAFWIKYSRLNRAQPNAILQVQARLYRAKALVDTCVCAALLSLVIAPESPISYGLDFIGSLVVALYLIFCGVQTILEAARGQ